MHFIFTVGVSCCLTLLIFSNCTKAIPTVGIARDDSGITQNIVQAIHFFRVGQTISRWFLAEYIQYIPDKSTVLRELVLFLLSAIVPVFITCKPSHCQIQIHHFHHAHGKQIIHLIFVGSFYILESSWHAWLPSRFCLVTCKIPVFVFLLNLNK